MLSKDLPFITEFDEIEFDVAATMSSLFLPIATSLLLAAFVYNIVQEREQRIREMMRMFGLKVGLACGR